ncbi:MAG TPA: thrombospondin type 3 repeat-containing protein [Kofleriaceae bacterium]|nr:thrombospondin type 3 repeat-containing protein [Kofleriaceae bacterium]
MTYIAVKAGGNIPLSLGGELELSFTPSWTGYGFESERPSYFAPVFGYRGQVIVRVGDGWLQPHVIGGIGGATVASSSPYMGKDTDPVYLWGVGATMAVSGRWLLRLDALQGHMPARKTGMEDAGLTATYEAHLSIGIRFGGAAPPVTAEHPIDVVDVTPPPPPPPDPNKDTDGDGIPDRLDTCPTEPESVNGIDDGDGCPEADADHDGIVGSADKCPEQPEDFDKFEDDDGCPELDNDKDGVADAKDACPNEPENMNGIADDDGCADQVPQELVKALAATGKAIVFDPGKVRLKHDTKAALDKALPLLLANRTLKIAITAHPEAADDAAKQLAAKRADVVKWYLVEQGVAAGNVTTKVGDVAAKKAPILELAIGS